MSTDELAVMDGGKCILQVQGVRPFFSDKFDITRHPQYKYLLDSSKKNAFDIEKYLRRRLTVRPDDVFESCELEAPSASDAPADGSVQPAGFFCPYPLIHNKFMEVDLWHFLQAQSTL